ncbi:DUF995 domain-containing protein [Shinella sp. HZN7]|uniref:DUF995 domain-containing protein n=1 Tax=Shinella sp. (strain HZN7) TaxID=879274 RepID=UPI0007DA4F1F|nr:DUF995 domain-containing protein [Shinella sp. HZN7]ANH09210.1 hypothetical protein shn_34425 [Shinella sp. HZN7]
MDESTMHQKSRRFRRLAVLAMAASLLAGAARAENVTLPADARAMTAVELYTLYRDKSWKWENGAGLMREADRHFSAWVSGGKWKSWAEGRWVITDTGLLCLKATWHTQEGSTPAKSCFSHQIAAGTIYQKREPDGRWYVFRHAIPRKNDEASKLVAADLVSQQRDAIQAALGVAPSTEQ